MLKDLVNNNPILKDVYEKFPLWFKYVMDVEGLPKSMGRHAAGTIVAPRPITDYVSLCYDKDKNVMIELEMHNVMDDLGLIKEDFLGLETLDIVDKTLKYANITWNDVDINHLDLNDQRVFDEVYKKGDTIGIFQMESAEARNMCIEASADNIDDIIAVNASDRPGTKASFPIYCKNKLHPEQIEVIHEDLRNIFGNTHCILLYQEQTLNLLRYAGFPEDEVDRGRRAIGKKEKKTMEELYAKFSLGLKNKGWNDSQIEEMWELVLKQSSYSFNQSHACAYGLMSYLTAYLKVHYPLEFMSALLTQKSDKPERLSVIINECKRLGIKVSPPNINKSGVTFTPIKESNEILYGLLGIKGLGESVVQKIIDGRPYNNFKSACEYIQDKTAIITLIKCGAFPIQDKVKMLKVYAESLCQPREFKPVNSLPTKKMLLDKYGIDCDKYKLDKRKIDKEKVLEIYNNKRKENHDEEQIQKRNQFMAEFWNKYCLDQYLWEFQTLSMFLTKDPLVSAYDYIESDWDKVEEGDKAVLFCVITDIKRKKDKHQNQFAYLDLYTPFGIIEATIWSAQLREYSNIIKKGNCLAMLGRKREGSHYFVEKVKLFEQWKIDKKF